MDWDKFINIWLVFANLLMALRTFMMVKETKKSIKLQEKQLKYFYSPTFVCVHESGGNGWPRIRIFNKGCLVKRAVNVIIAKNEVSAGA